MTNLKMALLLCFASVILNSATASVLDRITSLGSSSEEDDTKPGSGLVKNVPLLGKVGGSVMKTVGHPGQVLGLIKPKSMITKVMKTGGAAVDIAGKGASPLSKVLNQVQPLQRSKPDRHSERAVLRNGAKGGTKPNAIIGRVVKTSGARITIPKGALRMHIKNTNAAQIDAKFAESTYSSSQLEKYVKQAH